MSQRNYTYDQIEEYLEGSMTISELQAFEKELRENPALKEEVNAHMLATDLIIEKQLLNVKSTLKSIDKNAGSASSKWWLGGISLLLLLGTGVYLVLHENKIPAKEAQVLERRLKQESSITVISKDINPAEKKFEVVNKVILPKVPVKARELISPAEKHETEILPFAQAETSEPLKKEEATEQENKIPVPIPTPEPCKFVKITAKIATSPTCSNKSEGSIIVSELNGGTTPYILSLYDEENNALPSMTSLSNGRYKLIVKDGKGCLRQFENLNIGEAVCHKNQIFNPFLGETWEIPVYRKDGTLKVYDNSGNLYFSMDIRAMDKEQWTGQSRNGEQKPGYYPYEINYEDGSSETGTITIVK